MRRNAGSNDWAVTEAVPPTIVHRLNLFAGPAIGWWMSKLATLDEGCWRSSENGFRSNRDAVPSRGPVVGSRHYAGCVVLDMRVRRCDCGRHRLQLQRNV